MPQNSQDIMDLLDDPEILAEPVQPEAAIEFWKQRAKLTWGQASGLAAGAKARAFYVTGLYQQSLVDMVSDALEEALKNGETLEDFKERILQAINAQGWPDHRVENIFRTNMQSAYAAGRYAKMMAVKESRPYWQYIAVMDKRVRPSHAILHGLIYPADHDFWNSNYPPNGFRCRCGVLSLSERQVKSQGLTVEKDMPQAGMWTDPNTGMEYFVNFPGADNGFRDNPFKEWAQNGGTAALPGLKGFDGNQKKTEEISGTKDGVQNKHRLLSAKPDDIEIELGVKKAQPIPLTSAVKFANPDYSKGKPWQINCQRCVPTFEMRRRGYAVEALPNHDPKTNNGINSSYTCFKNPVIVGRRNPNCLKPLTQQDLLNELNALPDGARAGICWSWPWGGGHTIACEKINGKLVFVDPQNGKIGDISVLGSADARGYSYFRMDTLDFNKSLLKMIAK